MEDKFLNLITKGMVKHTTYNELSGSHKVLMLRIYKFIMTHKKSIMKEWENKK